MEFLINIAGGSVPQVGTVGGTVVIEEVARFNVSVKVELIHAVFVGAEFADTGFVAAVEIFNGTYAAAPVAFIAGETEI
jgi:hypothetical protein